MLKKALALLLVQALFIFAYASDIRFSGKTSYDRYGGTIRLTADRIDNYSGYTSGSLKIMLWATTRKYKGGKINGYVVGESPLDRLYANRYFYGISKNVRFYTPPRGSYFMTMTVSEYKNGRYEIVSYVNYPRKERF